MTGEFCQTRVRLHARIGDMPLGGPAPGIPCSIDGECGEDGTCGVTLVTPDTGTADHIYVASFDSDGVIRWAQAGVDGSNGAMSAFAVDVGPTGMVAVAGKWEGRWTSAAASPPPIPSTPTASWASTATPG